MPGMNGLWPSLCTAGLAANRPVAVSEPPANTFFFYFATDTGALSLWNPVTSTWATAPSPDTVTNVAAAGTNQATGGALQTGLNVVTAADGTKGVSLPATPVAGTKVYVKNTVSNHVLPVYPDPAATINAIAANAAISLAASVSALFIAASPTQWYTLPLLPS